MTKRQFGAAARLVDEGLILQTVINRVEGIFDRENETDGELLKAAPGVHQRGRIGKKIEAGHAVMPSLDGVW